MTALDADGTVGRTAAGTTGGGVDVALRGWGWRHAGRSRWAVRGLDLRLEAGERVLLLGASGAGKSTVLHALAGLLDAGDSGEEEGSIAVGGRPARAAREHTGLVLQDPEAQVVMAQAGDDVAFGLENAGVPAAEIWPRVDEALATAGFPYGRSRPTAALSGGEKQRLALAGALVRRPRLLLLDEPTANLDADGLTHVRDALHRVLAATGATLVLVEHRVADVLDLVDRVVVLEPGGGVAADGRTADVLGREGAALAARGIWVPGHLPGLDRPRRSGRDPVLVGRDVTSVPPGASTPAVADVDADLVPGEALAITGPNGSGKSTLALTLAGLVRPVGGTVRIAGSDRPLWQWRARKLARRVGTVFQDPEHAFVTTHVLDELALGPRRAGLKRAEVQRRVDELLDRLRLAHLAEANPYTLSGGEKRRLSVAGALGAAPDVLVLDEPTFGQDLLTWRELLALLAELRDDGRALGVVTHDEPFAAALAARELALVDGRVVP